MRPGWHNSTYVCVMLQCGLCVATSHALAATLSAVPGNSPSDLLAVNLVVSHADTLRARPAQPNTADAWDARCEARHRGCGTGSQGQRTYGFHHLVFFLVEHAYQYSAANQ